MIQAIMIRIDQASRVQCCIKEVIKGTYFEYKIPIDLFDSKEKLPQLTAYLEEKMGLTIVKEKRLETVYTIKFSNNP